MTPEAVIGFGRAAARRAKDRDRDLAHLFRADLKKYSDLTWHEYAWGYWDEVLAMESPDFYEKMPAEFRKMARNPSSRSSARDVAAEAIDKYEEFHRYPPEKIGSFPADFEIPQRMLVAGPSKWVTYRSGKVDPETLRRPHKPVNYIHEHDAGVTTYVAESNSPTTGLRSVPVPAEFRDVPALVKLGTSLGFCFLDSGKLQEVESRRPMPDLYTVPSGKCLLVIQSRRTVLAMMWGGALGVFARGIDG